MANITYQMISAINSAFQPGQDKHSYRKQNNTWGRPSGKVFSYSSRKELIQTATNLGKYLQKEYPEVKYVYQVSPEHIKRWLDTKVKNQQSTIDQYASRMRQIESICKEKYKTMDKEWSVKAPRGEHQQKLREVVCQREHLKHVMEQTKENECISRNAIEFASRFGTRVEETAVVKVKEIDFENKVIHFTSTKGNRERYLPINESDQYFLRRCVEGLNPSDRVFHVTPGAINKWLHSNFKKSGYTQYAKSKTGVHSIRKMVAQERYDECRNKGMSKEDSMGYVNEYLGHSYNRTSLNETYVANQW